MERHTILSTKKLSPALVEEAANKGLQVIEQEAISVKPFWNKEIFIKIIGLAKAGKFNVAFTSANAVEIVDRYMVAEDEYHVVAWEMFCLSGKTKAAIENAKFLIKNIIGEGENAAALAREIIAKGIKEIVFFCGNKRRDELPQILKEAGIKVHEIVVYETIETPTLSTEGIEAVLFFSPSAVQSFFRVNQLKENVVCFAIGDTTAATVADFTNNRIITSEMPSAEMMLTTVAFYFSHKQYDEKPNSSTERTSE